MRVRYASTVAAAIARARFLESFAASAATATLATSRLRSTVKSTPGSVSSKSLMSNTMFSSGVAKAPKFIRWQSPQACTEMPARRLMPEVLGHHRGSAAQEREWACKHALVANRHQLRHAGAIARG